MCAWDIIIIGTEARNTAPVKNIAEHGDKCQSGEYKMSIRGIHVVFKCTGRTPGQGRHLGSNCSQCKWRIDKKFICGRIVLDTQKVQGRSKPPLGE